MQWLMITMTTLFFAYQSENAAVKCSQLSSRCSKDNMTKLANTAGPGSSESVRGR